MAKTKKDKHAPVWEVRASGIHNQGIFARTRIPAEQDIIQYVGERISHEEADERGLEWEAQAQLSGQGAVYLFTVDENWVIDGNDVDNPARLINHSCDPNCEAVIYGEGDDAQIWLVSKREIAKGEELSFDYGFDLEDYKAHPCRCGARKCVGYIVGEEYRAKLGKLLGKKGAKSRESGKKGGTRKNGGRKGAGRQQEKKTHAGKKGRK